MGWLHVAETGLGIYLDEKQIMGISFDKLASIEIEDFQNLNILKSAPKVTTGFDTLTQDDLVNIYAEATSYYQNQKEAFQQFLQNGDFKKLADACKTEKVSHGQLSEIKHMLFKRTFCQKYNLPENCFVCINDYNGNSMFYCCLRVPLSEKMPKSIRQLTMESYERDLNAFCSEIFPAWEYQELQECEMYIKE